MRKMEEAVAMEAIKGQVQYVSPPFNGGWRLGEIHPHGKITGHLPDLEPGDLVVCQGTWKDHPKYGRQFAVGHLELDTPKDEMGIREYLARHFPWIGPVLAEKLVGEFGEGLFRVIEEEPERLASVKGVTPERAEEICGRYAEIKADREARTIHRLLEFHPEFGFQRNENLPLDCDTLIVDESSMIDMHLMKALCDALTTRTQVIFVGDVDQLPSVGPGRVLADMIEGGIPTAVLWTLHRQEQGSLINRNAQMINRGELPVIDNANARDFFFIPCEDKTAIPERIVQAVGRIRETFDFPLDEIQVLCPMKKGPCGTENLNKVLAPVLNPYPERIEGLPFHLGDRVIQLRNNYELEVFNGDIGIIEQGERDELHIRFGDHPVTYPATRLNELSPAYALTVHKSQGSEFGCVIIPVHGTNHIMLKRNLLYTGITRGKQLVVLVGTRQAIITAVKTVDDSKRFSGLAGRISGRDS